MTALGLAVINGHLSTVRILVSGGADMTISNGHTPLHIATQTTNAEILAALVEAGADDIEARNNDDITPLLWSAYLTRLQPC